MLFWSHYKVLCRYRCLTVDCCHFVLFDYSITPHYPWFSFNFYWTDVTRWSNSTWLKQFTCVFMYHLVKISLPNRFQGIKMRIQFPLKMNFCSSWRLNCDFCHTFYISLKKKQYKRNEAISLFNLQLSQDFWNHVIYLICWMVFW